MQKTATITRETPSVAVAPGFAISGWVVEVVMVMANDRPPERRFFAVGFAAADDAEAAVLRYPGLLETDKRIARPSLVSERAFRSEAEDRSGPAIWTELAGAAERLMPSRCRDDSWRVQSPFHLKEREAR